MMTTTTKSGHEISDQRTRAAPTKRASSVFCLNAPGRGWDRRLAPDTLGFWGQMRRGEWARRRE
jgi:hypothetical protein